MVTGDFTKLAGWEKAMVVKTRQVRRAVATAVQPLIAAAVFGEFGSGTGAYGQTWKTSLVRTGAMSNSIKVTRPGDDIKVVLGTKYGRYHRAQVLPAAGEIPSTWQDLLTTSTETEMAKVFE